MPSLFSWSLRITWGMRMERKTEDRELSWWWCMCLPWLFHSLPHSWVLSKRRRESCSCYSPECTFRFVPTWQGISHASPMKRGRNTRDGVRDGRDVILKSQSWKWKECLTNMGGKRGHFSVPSTHQRVSCPWCLFISLGVLHSSFSSIFDTRNKCCQCCLWSMVSIGSKTKELYAFFLDILERWE
jgi:hypothetical protein